MEMLLTILMASVIVLMLCGAIFAGVNRDERKAPEIKPDLRLVPEPARFFAKDASEGASQQPVPVEVLLSRIEHHIRLEQAAAETFLDVPNAETLHSRTVSPLVH